MYSAPEVVELCEKYHVFSRQELKAREDIELEQYLKTVHTEASLAIRMARTQIFSTPTAPATDTAAAWPP